MTDNRAEADLLIESNGRIEFAVAFKSRPLDSGAASIAIKMILWERQAGEGK